jgi:2,3-dihydroxyphenylpropionate 1,2-dioxygenase
VPAAVVTMSHSPLMGFAEPAPQTRKRVDSALDGAGAFVADFDPELVVLFGPDHDNGFFYDMLPSFCIGATAESVGDYTS